MVAVMKEGWLVIRVPCDKSGFSVQSLLNIDDKWVRPLLLMLPQRYYEIFRTYRHQTCNGCRRVPKDPALCLICGAFLCFRESCCLDSTSNAYECVTVSVCAHVMVSLGVCAYVCVMVSLSVCEHVSLCEHVCLCEHVYVCVSMCVCVSICVSV